MCWFYSLFQSESDDESHRKGEVCIIKYIIKQERWFILLDLFYWKKKCKT